jgi:hypothetical protein
MASTGDETDPLSEWDRAFAHELALCGGLPERILGQHRDDGSGRCTECTLGGQAGHSRYPCGLRVLATEALVLQGRTGLDGDRPRWLRRGAD